MKKRTKYIVCLSVVLSVCAGTASAAIDSWMYANAPYYGGFQSMHILIDGTATNMDGVAMTVLGTNVEIINASRAGFGKAVFGWVGGIHNTAYRAVAIPTNSLNIFSSANTWAATSSAGTLGAMVRTAGGSFDGKTTLTSHDGSSWSHTTIISQPLLFGCAIGDAAGLYVVPHGGYAGTRWYSSAGDAQLSATGASGCASTEGGALYYINGTGSFYIDEAGTQAGPLTGGSGGIGYSNEVVSAVVEGGALLNVGGVASVWSDSAQTFTAIDFGSGTNDEMIVVVAFGDDVLLQTAANGMFYYNSAVGSVVAMPNVTLLAGVSGGDFAFVRLDYVDDAQDGSYFYKDTGDGTYISWAYRIVDGTDHSYEPIYGVGGYAEIPAPPAAFDITIGTPFSGFVEIKWPTVATIPYQVQYSPGLTTLPGSWSNLGSVVTGDGTTNSYYDATTPDKRFYQVVIP